MMRDEAEPPGGAAASRSSSSWRKVISQLGVELEEVTDVTT